MQTAIGIVQGSHVYCKHTRGTPFGTRDYASIPIRMLSIHLILMSQASWCSWLSRLVNTEEVPSSILGDVSSFLLFPRPSTRLGKKKDYLLLCFLKGLSSRILSQHIHPILLLWHEPVRSAFFVFVANHCLPPLRPTQMQPPPLCAPLYYMSFYFCQATSPNQGKKQVHNLCCFRFRVQTLFCFFFFCFLYIWACTCFVGAPRKEVIKTIYTL